MPESDDETIARIAAGSHEALRELYECYRPRLWRYVTSHIQGDHAATDDLLQEVFLAVWQAAPDYRPQGKAAAWIFQIAHFQIARRRRILLRRPEEHQAPDAYANEDDPPGRIGNETIHTSSFEDALITRLAVTQALDRLSAAHREVLYLAFQQGFALQEIASILELPVGTVKSRISYARRALLHAYAQTQAHEESPL